MKVFHYTSIDRLGEIAKGSYKSRNMPGLGATRRMGHQDNEAFNTCPVFALLDPAPKEWVQNPHFSDIWQWLTADIGDLLLEIETDPKKDNVFVVDRAHIEGFLYDDKTGIPGKFLHISRKTAERALMQSKIPLSDFLAREQELQYSLPEVIFTGDVPFNRLSISSRQPLIEAKRAKYGEEWGLEMRGQLRRILEAGLWSLSAEAMRGLQIPVSRERR